MKTYTKFSELTERKQHQLLDEANTPKAPPLHIEPLRLHNRAVITDASKLDEPRAVSAVHIQLGETHRVFTMNEIAILIGALERAQRDLAASMVQH